MNFEAVLHYKHQNQARDEKKKLRHTSGANITNATTTATTAASAAAATSTEGSNSESEAESNENSPTPSPLQKKVTEVTLTQNWPGHSSEQKIVMKVRELRLALRQDGGAGHPDWLSFPGCMHVSAVRAEERLLLPAMNTSSQCMAPVGVWLSQL